MSKRNIVLVIIAVVLVLAAVGAIFGPGFLKSSDAEILEFKIGDRVGQIVPAEIKVNITLPYGTDFSKAKPEIKYSPKAKLQRTGPTTWMVTAENGKSKEWAVNVTVEKNTAAQIEDVSVPGQIGKPDKNEATSFVLTVRHGTDTTKLAPVFVVSEGATIDPASGTPQDFSQGPVPYKVTAQNGTVTDWTVTVTKAAANTGAEILKSWLSEITDESGKNEVNAEKREIHLAAIYGVWQIKDDHFNVELSPGATYTLKGNFPGTAICTVTSEDGKTVKEWKVTVTMAKPDKTIKFNEVFLNGEEAEIDSLAHTIRLEVAEDVPLNSIVVEGLKGNFAKMVPEIGNGDTLDFSDGAIKFALVAEDTTVCENWTVAVFHPMVTDLTKAVIGKGEGVEHALARQVVLSPVFWGYIGSLSDAAALKEWKGKKAHQIADSTGYVDYGINEQVGVKKAGVLYVPGKNDKGQTTVTEYGEMPKDADTKPTDTKVAGAKFEGADKEHLQRDYEYIFPLSTTCPPPSPCPCSCSSVSAPGAGNQQSGGGEEEINFPTAPVPVWPAGIPI